MEIKPPNSSAQTGSQTRAQPSSTQTAAQTGQTPTSQAQNNQAQGSQTQTTGQLLTAVVESVSPRPSSALSGGAPSPQNAAPSPQNATPPQTLFDVILRADGQRLEAQSTRPLQVGQVLNIEILSNSAIRVLTQPTATSNTAASVIQQGLREALPIQQSIVQLLNTLVNTRGELLASISANPLANPLTSPATNPGASGANPIARATAQLDRLLNQLPQLAQLQNPVALKQAVAQSGSLLEARLLQVLQTQAAATTQIQTGSTATQANPPASSQLASPLSSPLPPALERALQQTLGQDFKAQLLTLARLLAPIAASTASESSAANHLVNRLLQAVQQQQTADKPSQPASSLAPPQIALNQPAAVINRQMASRAGAKQSAREALDLTVSTLLRQIAATLARIQTNQLSALTAGQAGGADGQTLNSWHFEIPVFNQNQFHSIQLQIEERYAAGTEQQNEKNRQWHITLGFDFAGLGEFFATLRVVDTSVSTTFWSETPQTLRRIQNELQVLKRSLEKLGMDVNQIDCRAGKPPLQKTRLDQQLVDIKT